MLPMLTFIPSNGIKSESNKDSARSDAEMLGNMVQFVFISQIGGMVGGSSAISNSQYISSSGLIQFSTEETNGVLHTLMIGHSDESKFFKNMAKDPNICPRMKKPLTDKQNEKLSEYYPPITIVAYSFHGGNNVACEYFGEVLNTEVVENFVNQASDIIAKTKLYPAAPGLYVRATRLLGSNLNLIKFDLELECSDLLSFATLNEMLENKMALVRVGEKNGRAVISDNVVIKAGNPVHIRIGKKAYLIFPYHYNPHN
jgi:hypothetical protein